MSSRIAFTLLELLMVISIIALLSALLLPMFGVVRAQSRMISCQSNMRGMAQAFETFARENEGLLPYGQTSASNWASDLTNFDENIRYTCPAVRIRAGTRHFTANMQTLTDKSFGAHTGTLRAVHTSELRPAKVLLFDGGQQASGSSFVTSENMGFTFFYFGKIVPPAPTADDRPSSWSSSGTFRVDNRHGNLDRANYLYSDGHVQCLRPTDLTCGDFRIPSGGRSYFSGMPY